MIRLLLAHTTVLAVVGFLTACGATPSRAPSDSCDARAACAPLRACLAGNSEECWTAGSLLLDGVDAPKRATHAIEVFERGCSLNSKSSCQTLYRLYSQGYDSVPVDAGRAYQNAERLCERHGDSSACEDAAVYLAGAPQNGAPLMPERLLELAIRAGRLRLAANFIEVRTERCLADVGSADDPSAQVAVLDACTRAFSSFAMRIVSHPPATPDDANATSSYLGSACDLLQSRRVEMLGTYNSLEALPPLCSQRLSDQREDP